MDQRGEAILLVAQSQVGIASGRHAGTDRADTVEQPESVDGLFLQGPVHSQPGDARHQFALVFRRGVTEHRQFQSQQGIGHTKCMAASADNHVVVFHVLDSDRN